MGRFLLGLIIGVALVVGAGFVYFTTGMVPVAATAQPMPFERMFAHDALHAKLNADAPKVVPIQPTGKNLLAGAMVYAHNCAFCHGLPQGKPSVEGRGMFPHAPQLFTTQGMVNTDPPGFTYWKVKNGIRLTGMPSFHAALTDQQIWQVSMLLHEAANLPPQVAAALAPAAAAPAKPATPTKPAPKHR